MAAKTVSNSFVLSSNEDLSESFPTSSQRSQPILTLEEVEKLPFQIHRYSSFSTNYCPENILVDCPKDQTSRWSALTNSPPQYLILKLKRPAIVKQIKFGKFEKSHVCNLKKFRIYGGLEENHMVLLLESGLTNDNKPEMFTLLHTSEDGSRNIPLLFLKIVPLLTWGPTFNYSIWYVELHGQDDPMYTSECLQNYNMMREVEIVKLCLKHFRQQGYKNAYMALQEQTKVKLEHPLITQLHEILVDNGDFARSEQFIKDCIYDGHMDAYLLQQDYKHSWQQEQMNGELQPSNRGGHQLIMDSKNRVAYLYGGWNGYQDLTDLWLYQFDTKTWSIIMQHDDNRAPPPRSCHKMVLDPIGENIFMLGRYLDNSVRTIEYIKSDFYLYDTRAHTWLLICDDTSQVGGPQLVYDHQMCIDVDKRTIYVFGGKVLTPRSVTNTTSNDPEFSGLYSYHIATNTWSHILVDCHHPTAAFDDVRSIKARVTHCMVFHSKLRKLFIFGGQRGKEDMDEFITYDVDSQNINVLNKSEPNMWYSECKNEPCPGYTLRATIDCDRNEIYVFSSLSKLKDRKDVQKIDASNSFWVYSIAANKWSRIYTRRHSNTLQRSYSEAMKSTTGKLDPSPRFAHQMMYDDVTRIHYLFGGNPGRPNMPQLRLDDFWTLTLEKPKREDIFKHCRFLVRKLHYEEIVQADPILATEFLRSRIAEIVDHTDVEQQRTFHELATLLFNSEEIGSERASLVTPPLGYDFETDCKSGIDAMKSHNSGEESITSKEDIYDDMSLVSVRSFDRLYKTRSHRSYLFNKIVRMMPPEMVQPQRNISDFVM